MADNEFVNGLILETKTGKYGEYIKGTLNVEEIFTNPINNGKYLNFMIFKSKGGKWYSVISKPQTKTTVIDEEEIPF